MHIGIILFFILLGITLFICMPFIVILCLNTLGASITYSFSTWLATCGLLIAIRSPKVSFRRG